MSSPIYTAIRTRRASSQAILGVDLRQANALIEGFKKTSRKIETFTDFEVVYQELEGMVQGLRRLHTSAFRESGMIAACEEFETTLTQMEA